MGGRGKRKKHKIVKKNNWGSLRTKKMQYCSVRYNINVRYYRDIKRSMIAFHNIYTICRFYIYFSICLFFISFPLWHSWEPNLRDRKAGKPCIFDPDPVNRQTLDCAKSINRKGKKYLYLYFTILKQLYSLVVTYDHSKRSLLLSNTFNFL